MQFKFAGAARSIKVTMRTTGMAALLALSFGLQSAQPVAAQGVATPASPATPAPLPSSPAKKELVAKILKLQQPGIEALARTMVEQPAAQLMQQAGLAMQRMPTEKRDAIARDIEADVRKYAEDVVPAVQTRAVRLAPSTLGRLMDERFTEEELKEVLSILESPVNRKFQSMSGDMQRVISEQLVSESRAEIEPKVRALQASMAKRLGITPGAESGGSAGGASTKPSAPKK